MDNDKFIKNWIEDFAKMLSVDMSDYEVKQVIFTNIWDNLKRYKQVTLILGREAKTFTEADINEFGGHNKVDEILHNVLYI